MYAADQLFRIAEINTCDTEKCVEIVKIDKCNGTLKTHDDAAENI